MKYDPKEEWQLIRVEELKNHKVNLYVFRSYDSVTIEGYDMKKVAERAAKSEEEAWNMLSKIIWKNNLE